VLVEKIKAEKERLIKEKKIKKQKPLPPITDEEIPFQIPENWVWCRLGGIIYNTEGGKSPNCQNKPADGDNWGVIKTTAVQEMNFLQHENKILPENYVVNPKHIVEEGDVLITRAGPKNRVGIVCCVEALTLSLVLSDKTIRILHNKELINSKFVSLSLNSPLIKPIIEIKMTGMAESQVNISQDNIKGFSIPLPPLSEQQRIVAKLDKLMKYCDELEASIKESQWQNEMLLQQVLREALDPKEKEVEKQKA
jgi:type I restriction enzyme S subunit